MKRSYLKCIAITNRNACAVVRETGTHKLCDSTETYGFEHKKCSHNTKTMQEKKTE
ncbi:hypothetical protein APHWI1_1249 [Anaplasma phagocytophilum str. ApWI1]|uniref:Uncharacterized protein n=3 Tax=Anaplasma phagocytophilum TaxID=948 RepID=Q2GL95_ANAPZ|nr:hypothetical protein APH_0239 [Anaplasma phagocytophilum str. HZ]KJV59547.1 hypothetical protein APHWEB_0270 [Anaplasma phagocytophilum str. Webster]KJV68120.1 hypothetical protein EPHNCH_0463 [Anaplasma phagocytophilum str. NCH-1]KJV83212.1 hypothetical protein APHHGE2_0476 [Anaplasma phagocytophilum str. HGE2]KJV85617.1 hypothetical protein APHWI1_1249 [Anaplasma phagocytophilum str. ApWI1]KJV88284.1 hypothetical protein APHNYW_0203 [Anaplasma phagocytophilum str. ApNYW]KJV99429.1 hypoth